MTGHGADTDSEVTTKCLRLEERSTTKISASSWDKQRGEDSVAMYLQRLRERAKEFGVTREKQLDKALELFNQLKALMTLHDNCTPDEQKEMGCTTPEVLEWIRNPCITDYDEIDAYFRQHQQRAWIREI
jgi:hypothetical protein